MKSGLLLIDKTSDCTSHDVVGQVRRLLKTKEVGHTGTLDPFATGLMVLLIGQATKISDYLRDSDKSYWLQAQLGSETDTLDYTGNVTQSIEREIDPTRVKTTALSAQGEIEMPIPRFSAKKINGKKLYEYAREGKPVDIPLKKMTFYDLQLDTVTSAVLEGEISCKSGSFIRSWAQHVGEKSGALAHLKQLRRTRCCGYSVDQALTVNDLQQSLLDPDSIDSMNCFIPLSRTMPQLTTLTVKGKDAELLRNGQISHNLSRRLNHEKREAQQLGLTVPIKILNGGNGQLLSILEARPQARMKIRRVFESALLS